MEFVVTAEQKFRDKWGILVNEMNAHAFVRAGALEGEDTPCKLYFTVSGGEEDIASVCTPVAAFTLSVVAPALIAAEVRSSPEKGLVVGLEPATIEAVAKAGALRHTRWMDIATRRIAESLMENPALSLEGFLRFRMRDLLDTLSNELHSLLGALNIEEEYRRFIELIKRYALVNRKETETLTVRFDEEGGYTLLTASSRHLLSVPWQMDGQESGHMLITLLDSIAPARVMVQGSAFSPPQLCGTISSMFGERARFDT